MTDLRREERSVSIDTRVMSNKKAGENSPVSESSKITALVVARRQQSSSSRLSPRASISDNFASFQISRHM